MARLSITTDTIRRLFAHSGNMCAMPDCSQHLVNKKGIFVGNICHIEAANKGGQRFNPNQTDEERRHFNNLMLLCYAHHIETNDEEEYPTERLRSIKNLHEQQFAADLYELPRSFEENIFRQVKEKLEQLLDISSDTNSKVSELLKLVESGIIKTGIDEEKIYLGQLNSIRELRKNMQHRSALKMLYEYKRVHWERLTPEIKYKVLANIGLSHLDLQEKKEAAHAFGEMHDIGWDTEDALGLQAIGCALNNDAGQFDLYFKKCTGINDKNLNAWVAYLLINQESQTVEQLSAVIPAAISEQPEILFNLGEIALSKGFADKGIALLKQAEASLAGEPAFTADIRSAIASKILGQIVTPVKFLYGQFSKDELNYLQEAYGLLTQSWSVIKGTELASARWHIIMNRGITAKLLNRKDAALHDLLNAYELSGNFTAFKNLALTYIQHGRFDAALELCEAFPANDVVPANGLTELQMIKGKALCGVGRMDEGLEILSGILEIPDAEFKMQVLLTIISCCLDFQEPAKAVPYGNMLCDDFPNDINSYIASGHIYWKLKQGAKALEFYNKAYSLADRSTPPNIIYELADSLLEFKEFFKASDLYARVVNEKIYNPAGRALVYAYYQSGDINSALRLAEAYFNQAVKDPLQAEIIIKIYQEINDYPKALRIAESYIPHAPAKYQDIFKLKLAELYYHLKDFPKLLEAAAAVAEPMNLSLDDCFNLAVFLLEGGNPSLAMDVAYKARLRHFGAPHAHSRYMHLMTLADEKFPVVMFPDKVEPEYAVTLSCSGAEDRTMLITDDDGEGEHILRPSDPFCKLLLGQPKGACVTQEKKFGIKETYTINGIMHKYVFAARESMELFRHRFAGVDGFEVLTAQPGTTDDPLAVFVKNMSASRLDIMKEVYKFYNQGKATIGVLAGLCRQGAVQQWLNTIGSPDIFFYHYTAGENDDIQKAISGSKPLVIDITALLVCFFLYPENNLLELPDLSLWIAQATMDDLVDFYDEITIHREKGRTSVGFEEGKLAIFDYGPENFEQTALVIERLIAWCKAKVTIKSPQQNLLESRNARERFVKILGQSSYDTIWLAREIGGVVLSGDDIFRRLLRREHGVAAFSNYQLGVFLFQQKKLAAAELILFAERLIKANHIYIPVGGDLLWKLFDQSGYQLCKPFTTAVKGLLIMMPVHCADTVVVFSKLLYMHVNIASSREQVIQLILQELSAHPAFVTIKVFIIGFTNIHFKLLQKQAQEFLRIVNHF